MDPENQRHVDDDEDVRHGFRAAAFISRTEPPSTATQTTLVPYFDRLVVERDPERTEHAPGILVAESFKDSHKELVGTVVAVGPGRLLPDGRLGGMYTRVGDRVVFGEFAGRALPERFGQRLMVLREDEVVARVRAGGLA